MNKTNHTKTKQEIIQSQQKDDYPYDDVEHTPLSDFVTIMKAMKKVGLYDEKGWNV